LDVKPFHIGVTGSRTGITDEQIEEFHKFIKALMAGFSLELHHGDCIGADSKCHALADKYNIPTHIHPPDKDTYRAFNVGGTMYEPKPYLMRNHDIVDASELLFVIPNGPEQLRSGTWATWRYAKRTGTKWIII